MIGSNTTYCDGKKERESSSENDDADILDEVFIYNCDNQSRAQMAVTLGE